MKLTNKEITLLTTGISLVLVGLAFAGIFILVDTDKYLFLGTSIGDGFVAVATFFFVFFGLGRYITTKNLSQDETKKANKIATWFSLGISIIVLFLIPFGKIMIERDNGLVVWAVALASALVIVGSIISVVAGINWKQEVIDKK